MVVVVVDVVVGVVGVVGYLFIGVVVVAVATH